MTTREKEIQNLTNFWHRIKPLTFHTLVVDELPTTSPSSDILYLVPNPKGKGVNLYTEYVYVKPSSGDPFWEQIGGGGGLDVIEVSSTTQIFSSEIWDTLESGIYAVIEKDPTTNAESVYLMSVYNTVVTEEVAVEGDTLVLPYSLGEDGVLETDLESVDDVISVLGNEGGVLNRNVKEACLMTGDGYAISVINSSSEHEWDWHFYSQGVTNLTDSNIFRI